MLATRSFVNYLLLAILTISLAACAITEKIEPVKPADFYTLQAVPTQLQNKTFVESLTFNDDQARKLLTQIETGQDTVNLAALTFSGVTVVQAQWHQQQGLVSFSSPVFEKEMIVRIIRDIQLVKWPEKNLVAGLTSGFQVSQFVSSNSSQVREIRQTTKVLTTDNQPIIRISYLNKRIRLQNFIENYEFVIEQINE